MTATAWRLARTIAGCAIGLIVAHASFGASSASWVGPPQESQALPAGDGGRPIVSTPPVHAAAAAAQGERRPRRRLFPPQDLGLLAAPDRDRWQKPDLIMDALGIADGSVVADLGAGGGWFTLRLARRVGPNGIVYAEDIQPQMIEATRRRMQHERLPNVRMVLGSADDPRLPPSLDAVLIVDVYPELDDPVALLKNVAKALKPQGRLGICGYNPGAGGPGPSPDQRVDPDSVVSTATAAGFQLIAREPVVPFQWLLVFGKAMEPATKPGPAAGGAAR